MPAARYWKPGRKYTGAIPGRSWFIEELDALFATVVLDGLWYSNWSEAIDLTGPWDTEVEQIWTVRIPKDAQFAVNDLFDPPVDGEDIPFFYWEMAFGELYDKPRRAIRTGIEHGEVVSRIAVTEIGGVRLTDLGLIWFDTATDRRAWRQRQQARVRADVRRAAVRRRERNGRRWKDDRDADWRGYNRYWFGRRSDPHVIEEAR